MRGFAALSQTEEMTISHPSREVLPEGAIPVGGEEEWHMPPGLKRSLPFYAFKPWVKLGRPILLFEHLLKTYGNIASYRFMGTPIVFLNDPVYIREVLVNQALRSSRSELYGE